MSTSTMSDSASNSSSSIAPSTGENVDNSNQCCVADDPDETRETCDVLCSLGGGGAASSYSASAHSPASSTMQEDGTELPKSNKKTCPKQHQLPMFLSSKWSRRSDAVPFRETLGSHSLESRLTDVDVRLYATLSALSQRPIT